MGHRALPFVNTKTNTAASPVRTRTRGMVSRRMFRCFRHTSPVMKSNRIHAEACYHEYILRIPKDGQFDILSGHVGSGGMDRFSDSVGLIRPSEPRRFPSSDSGNVDRRMIQSAVVHGRTEFRIRSVRWNSFGCGSGVWFSNCRADRAAGNPYTAREIKNPPAFEAGGFLGKIGVKRSRTTCLLPRV